MVYIMTAMVLLLLLDTLIFLRQPPHSNYSLKEVFENKAGQREYACISTISTASKYQKSGYGSTAVKGLVSFLFRSTDIDFVISDARPQGSKKTFQAPGFYKYVPITI